MVKGEAPAAQEGKDHFSSELESILGATENETTHVCAET